MIDLNLNITEDFEELLKDRDAIAIDLNGVIQNSVTGKRYPQAAKMIDAALSKKVPVYIISNSTMSEKVFEKKISNLGYELGKHYHGLLSAGMAFKALIMDEPLLRAQNVEVKNYKIFAVGHMFSDILADTKYSITNNMDEADFVYLGIPQIKSNEYSKLSENIKKGFTKSYIVEDMYDVLAESEEAVKYFYDFKIKDIKLPIINANQDVIVDENTPNGPVSLARQNYFGKMAEAEGKKIIKIGKHYPYIFSHLMSIINKDRGKCPANVVYVGDNLSTDIAGFNLYKEICTKKESLKNTGIALQSTCVLAVNDYWKKNNKTIADILNMLDKNQISKNEAYKKISQTVEQQAVFQRAIPDVIAMWTTKG